jgi:nicotinamidase-related amidase
MKRDRFPITSEQMELLLAFERAGTLEDLSNLMAKDTSVISRRLQLLASSSSFLKKVNGRWQITFQGRKLNDMSREFLKSVQALIEAKKIEKIELFPEATPLLVINTQKALHYSDQGRRNNLHAENNILKILNFWRKNNWPIIHIKHLSLKKESRFYKGSIGTEFITELSPKNDECIIEKYKSSAFANTDLENHLIKMKAKSLVIVGFTAGECVDATARSAKDLDFEPFVVGDATATFDIVNANGKLVKAEKIHNSVLANLHTYVSKVIDTHSIISSL